MTDTMSPLDHVLDAIAGIDTEVAAIVAQLEQLQDRADELGAARIDLVAVRDRLNGPDPAPTREAPQRAAPDATPAGQSARRAATPPDPKKKPAAKPAARSKPANGAKYDLAEVARIAREAIADGRSAPRAIVDELDAPSPAAASMAISKARKAGHDIPKVRTGGNGKTKRPAETPTTHQTSDSAVLPYRRPSSDDVADLEAQAGLPT